MRSPVIAIIAFLLLTPAWVLLHYFSPQAEYRKATQQALEVFSQAVASKDQAKIHEALTRFIDDSARIRLDITFASLSGNAGEHTVQDFSKADFIAFIGNTLYSLNDYGYTGQLEYFSLSADRQSALVKFTSREWAKDMPSYGAGGISLRFDSDTTCEGQVVFKEMRVLLSKVACKTRLHSLPQAMH